MKKALLLVCVLALALGITYLVLHKSSPESAVKQEKDVPLPVSSKTSAFNRSFASTLDSYYNLSASFITGDTATISAAAGKLNTAVDSIRFDQFKADSAVALTALSVTQAIQGEILGLVGEKTMEQKKREFNMITEDLYSLIRVIKYDGSIIYHMRCTTAFADSTEAYWLSSSPQIINPYLGKNSMADHKMPPAYGELSDSLHFPAPVSE